MNQSECADERTPAFDETLLPHDSLGGRGLAIFTVSLLAVASVTGLILTVSGLWIIALFLIGDLTLLLFAAHLLRKSRKRSERIVIDRGSLVVSRYRAQRLVDQRRLAVFGLSLEREDDPDFGCQRLSLILRGKRYEVAHDLAPEARDAFACRLSNALAQAGGSSMVRRIDRPSLLTGEPIFAR